MRLLPSILTVALVLSGAGFASNPAEAQNADGFKRCGDKDIVLVFMNPDLRVRDDGFIHASGKFFIQFQARGANAMKIDTFKFSFGKTANGFPESCDTPEWITGAYIKNYRADNDWRDGFFVPINTYNVGDGEYAAAISAYDVAGTELVRYYAKAKVLNGGRQHSRDGCPAEGGKPLPCKDSTAPWPMILPGDGERLDGKPGLYVEVAEDVAEITATLNGRKLELAETTPPLRDDDLVPDLGYGPLKDQPQSEGQVQSVVWGKAWNWDGVIRTEDVIKVTIKDLWGNVAEKVVHIGDPTIGGRVTGGNPDFAMEVDDVTQETDANGTAVWNVLYRTKTAEGIHGDLYLKSAKGEPLPDGITARLNPNHVMMGGNEVVNGTVRVTAGPGVPARTYDLELIVDYLAAETRLQKAQPLKFVVTSTGTENETQERPADRSGTDEQEVSRGKKVDDLTANEVPPADEPTKKVPGFELVALLAAVGVAFAARQGRRNG